MPLPIRTERLEIRPFELADAEQIHEAYADPAVGWPLAPDGVSGSVEETRGILDHVRRYGAEHEGLGPWAVVERASVTVIGDCGLFRCEDAWAFGELEIAYRLRRASWGSGLATEAAGAVLRYAFDELHAERVVADADGGNARSLRVLEKLGMQLVGREGAVLLFATGAPPAPSR